MKLSKPFKYFLIFFVFFLILGFAVEKNSYVGVVSCKIRVDTTIFGIEVSSKYKHGEMSKYLESLVGVVDEEQYKVSRVRSLFGGYVVGTPSGNWMWIKTLKSYEEKGLVHETAIAIAMKLISNDENVRQSAIDQILQLQDST